MLYAGQLRPHRASPSHDEAAPRRRRCRFEGGRGRLMLRVAANIRQPNRRKMRTMHADPISGRADGGDVGARGRSRTGLSKHSGRLLDVESVGPGGRDGRAARLYVSDEFIALALATATASR